MALRDTDVLGFAVPAGRVCFANSHALSFGAAQWTEPERFRPSRWLREERGLSTWGEDAPAGAHAFTSEERAKFIPFSIGQRSCPGERLARAELEAATLALLRAARWDAVGTVDLREAYSLTLVPQSSQALRFQPL